MTTPTTPLPTLDEDSVRDILRQVIDPEVGMNIVDLGLIYGIECAPEHLRITMTMTTPACPMADMIIDDIKVVLSMALSENVRVDVDLVWEPAWNREMMSNEARKHFGW
ncbi:MAG: metal-sulfur cluster assembly factor [Rhodocyclales bacterium]|nr:metal-sulfur cluster assembly factor [Rhodocyclales bacterium]